MKQYLFPFLWQQKKDRLWWLSKLLFGSNTCYIHLTGQSQGQAGQWSEKYDPFIEDPSRDNLPQSSNLMRALSWQWATAT